MTLCNADEVLWRRVRVTGMKRAWGFVMFGWFHLVLRWPFGALWFAAASVQRRLESSERVAHS